MDHWISRWNTSFFGALIKRVPKLQTTFESWPRRFEGFAKLKALGLGLFAVVMGIVAYNTCCEETSFAWVKAHFPSQTVWQSSLISEGLQTVKDPHILAKALKNLPARVETGNQVWEGKIDGTSSWWVIYPGKGQSDPLLVCRDCNQIPKKWQPVGEGWAALDLVVSQIKKSGPALVAKKAFNPIAKIDPREIRY